MESLIVGLGNPGKKYTETRHNIGFRVLEEMASDEGVAWENKGDGYYAHLGDSLLLRPTKYMNLSGPVVSKAMRENQLESHQVLVVLDDVHLELGILRFRDQGGSGGHNGLKSIIESIDSDTLPRLRLGVGFHEPLDEYVLSEFEENELDEKNSMIQKAKKTVLHWVSSDKKEMNQWIQTTFKKKETNE